MLFLVKLFFMIPIVAIQFNEALFFKFLKFGLVGFSGLIVDFSITYLCKERLRLPKYLSSSLGFMVATATNYSLNRFWTFHNQDPAYIAQFSRFFVVSVVGLVMSNLLIYVMHDKMKWNFYFSKACAIVFVSLLNFFGNYLYTFAS